MLETQKNRKFRNSQILIGHRHLPEIIAIRYIDGGVIVEQCPELLEIGVN
jgi:hypothetical protein